jgi:hypothetical protein
MKMKSIISFIIIPIVLFLLNPLSIVNSAEEKFSAKVYPKKGGPMVIENFNRDDNGPQHFFTAVWRGSSVKLFFHEIESITFINKPLDSEVIFNDGRKDKFKITGSTWMRGKSKFGDWVMNCSDMAKIDFATSALSNTPKAAISKNFDQILFKNGDLISGSVKTGTFKLRTSYATLNFMGPEISYIKFDGGGQNIDIVSLKSGDKLSGVIETPIVKVLIRSGKEISLDKEKIKKITFKK